MNGMPFMQTAHAVDVTRLGARLVDLFCLPEIGEITIQHGSQKAKYKIAWTGTMGGAEAGQVGLRLMEPEKNIWGKALAKGPAVQDRQADSDNDDEGPARRPSLGGGNGGSAVATAAAPVYARQRMHPRYSAHATTEVLPDGGHKPVWATLTKISAGGFYAETPSPLPTETLVKVTLRTLVGEIRANGITRSSHAAAGMGIAFIHLVEQDRVRLERFIDQVMRGQDVNLGVAMIEPMDQERTHAVPAPKLPKKTVPALPPERIAENARLAARLQSLIKELRELQEAVNSSDLDHRVTRSFQNSVTHTHQNAEYLAQWLRAANEGKDPYPIIVEINAERVRIAAEQARELGMDIDSQEIEHSTQGLEKLTKSVAALHKRLTGLLKD